MTHDEYKAALDEINRIFYYESPVWVSIYKEPKLSDKLMYTIRHALTLASEYERVKNERDELARIILMVEDGSDSPVDEDEWDYIVKICREAKKVSEQNGNARCDLKDFEKVL